jgi:hypothetical protein
MAATLSGGARPAYHLRVCARGHRYEVFIDGDLLLQFHAFNQPGPLPGPRSAGLFIDRGYARIVNLSVFALREPNG